MIIFCYGPDAYRLRSYAEELEARYRAKYASGFNLISCEGGNQDTPDMLIAAFRNASFFDEVKLVKIMRPFANKSQTAAFVQLANDQDIIARKDIVLMALEARTGKELKAASKELFELLSRKGNTVQEFEYLNSGKLTAWIAKEAQRLDASLAPGAAAALVERVSADTWTLSLELTKLANFAGRRPISIEDVRTLVALPDVANVFTLVDAFAQRQYARFAELLYRDLAGGMDPYYVLTMLTYQVRNLVTVKDLLERRYSLGDIAKTLALHPFVARKTVDQARVFRAEELIALFQHLADLEQRTKQGTAHLNDQLFLLA